MNPGGSVKDRAGRQMILEAEARGELRAGGLVVESTAGNTGIGLALVANARGYRTLIVIQTRRAKRKKICCACAAPITGKRPRSLSAIRTTISMLAADWRSN